MFWQWDIGGVQTRMSDVIDYLVHKKHSRVTLLLRKKIDTERQLPSLNLLFKVIYCPRFLSWSRWLFFVWLLLSIWMLKPSHILTLLNRFHLIGVLGKWLLVLKGVRTRVILNQPIVTSRYIRQFEHPVWQILVSIFFNKADKIIVQTQAVANDLINTFNITPKLIFIVKNWTKKRKMIIAEKKYDLIFVGRLSKEKHIDSFLKVCNILRKKIPTFSACIVGDGVERNFVHSYISHHNLIKTIDYMGFQNNPLLFIQQAKLMYLPSENEGMPMSVIEAMSVGVPAIVRNFPGADELISNGHDGFICPDELTSSLITYQLLSDTALYRRLAQSACNTIHTHYDRKNLVSFVNTLLTI
jgi:glycosyltransferase involved in cell wall biosynthesis